MTPKLRFPEFTDNWTVTELGECSDIQTGKALPSSDILEFGDRLICRGINVKSGFLESNSEINRFTNSFIDRKYLVQNDDILLPMDGSKVGKNIAVADLEFHNSFLIQRVARIRLPKELVWFYFQQLWSWNFERYVFTINTSSGIPHISEKQIRRFKVSKPSLEEAHKISSLFELVNKKINLLTKKKEALETYKKGLMQKIFSQELRFKREDGTYYPEWRRVKLGDIQEFKNGKPTEPYWCENGKYEVITLNSVSINGKLKASGRTTDFNDNSLEKGDLVMVLSDIAHANLLGLCDVIPSEGFILNQRMGRLRVAAEVDPYFLRYAINRRQKYFKQKGQGTSQKHIYQRDVDSLTIELPCFDEQMKITETLKSIDLMTSRIFDANSQTSEMKKGLLQQMFV
jgi:type I restriction enzyme, S subunit